MNEDVKEEHFLILANSAEFASQLAPLVEVDKLDDARVPEQVPQQSKPRHYNAHQQALKQPRHQSMMISFIHSGMPRNICCLHYAGKPNHEFQKYQLYCHKHTYAHPQWAHQDINQEQPSKIHYPA